MSQTCQRCCRIVHRACQSEAEWLDCEWLKMGSDNTMKTNRDLKLLSSPACSPRYTLWVPKGADVIAVPTNAGLKTPTGYALDRPQDYGCNNHDAIHYFFWVPADAVDTEESTPHG